MAQLLKVSVKDQKEKDFEEWLFLTIWQGREIDLDQPLQATFHAVVATVKGTRVTHLFYVIQDIMYVTELGSTKSFRMLCDTAALLDIIAMFG